ncbi:DUF86 domain-containing protein [Haliea sp. E1-2-M8]|uniref:type VII toxin-antitoxin system HepT family RNase toxin n=1 Tax=Haliea sp. E1-2-M8 TaxID=3064706 RepID=UPI002720E75B|nr:DUF86 domain-containing protein [Haliea sp. E1-2-M8]MDO8862456.1 DUF86 domain-containing protein [Haliea sp. E1-2-M8]
MDNPALDILIAALQAQPHIEVAWLYGSRRRVGPLTFNERNAAERGLQVLVEMAIGCAKHVLKCRGKPVPTEARAAIERVYELIAIVEPSATAMRGAVGMRNAIFHDYLNIDWRLLEAVLNERNYRSVAQFIETVAANCCNRNPIWCWTVALRMQTTPVAAAQRASAR